MLPLLAAIGGGASLIGSIGKMFGRDEGNAQMREILKKIQAQKINPEYGKIAAETAAEKNARMAGATAAERNIYQAGANTMANIQRAATDPNAVILGAGGVQGQQNVAFEGLQQQEAADYTNRAARAREASMAKANAEDELNRYKMQAEAQIGGAMQENRQNTWGDIAGLGMAGLNLAAAAGGGYGSLFGKGVATSPTSIKGLSPMEGVNMSPRGVLAMPPQVTLPSYTPQLPYTPSFNFQQYPQQGMGNAYYNNNWWNPRNP